MNNNFTLSRKPVSSEQLLVMDQEHAALIFRQLPDAEQASMISEVLAVRGVESADRLMSFLPDAGPLIRVLPADDAARFVERGLGLDGILLSELTKEQLLDIADQRFWVSSQDIEVQKAGFILGDINVSVGSALSLNDKEVGAWLETITLCSISVIERFLPVLLPFVKAFLYGKVEIVPEGEMDDNDNSLHIKAGLYYSDSAEDILSAIRRFDPDLAVQLQVEIIAMTPELFRSLVAELAAERFERIGDVVEEKKEEGEMLFLEREIEL